MDQRDRRDEQARHFEELYDLIRRKAHLLLPRKGRAPLLSRTTDLINEAYLRVSESASQWSDKEHFKKLFYRAMRHAIIDHVRGQGAKKRGGDSDSALEELARSMQIVDRGRVFEVLAIGEALERLEAQDEELARIVECMLLAGLTMDGVAAELGVPKSRVIKAKAAFQLLLDEGTRAAEG